ncbi:MAG: FtsX-like permease family protein, partial [Ferruginibacter sp.]|nr:FtsX-like permease family protein [Ferruginibacter sp.]
SMVVPGSFMKYANANFTSRPSEAIDYYRLIVEVKPQKLVQFQEYINSMGYETNEELLKSGKFASLLQAILAVVLLLGIIMIVNAFFGFLLYLQLIISRSKYELETLLRLGYRHKKLIQWYTNSIGFILFVVAAVALFILFVLQGQVSGFVSTYGFEFPATISNVVVLTGTGLIILLYLIFYVSVRKQIYRLSLPK